MSLPKLPTCKSCFRSRWRVRCILANVGWEQPSLPIVVRLAIRKVVHVDVNNMSHGRFPVDVDVFDRLQSVSGVRIEE